MSKALLDQLLTRRLRPANFILVALAVAGLLGCTTIVIWLATSSPRNIWAPRVLTRSYRATPLGGVIAELERDGIIPKGTSWSESELRSIPVTVDLEFLSTDFAALKQVALAAQVHIQVPVGQHGELRAPVTIRRSDGSHKNGAWGHHYRLPAP